MFQIGLRAEVRIEKAVAIPARRETGPPVCRIAGNDGGQLPPQRAEEIHQLHLFGCLAPCLQQKRGAYDDGERFRS